MLSDQDLESIRSGRHGDPFAVLGPHTDPRGQTTLTVFQPGARAVQAIDARSGAVLTTMTQRHADGVYTGVLPATVATPKAPAAVPAYRLRITWADGQQSEAEDPYRFPPLLGELDAWLLGEGSHLRPFEILGAIPRELEGVAGTGFAVWAPNAMRVSVVGDFNDWDGRRHPMRLRRECGVWEIFLPGVAIGAHYKFELLARDGQLLPLKADPYARQAELRPATASIVAVIPPVAPPSTARQRANALDAPMSIYEVHLGSWKRRIRRATGRSVAPRPLVERDAFTARVRSSWSRVPRWIGFAVVSYRASPSPLPAIAVVTSVTT